MASNLDKLAEQIQKRKEHFQFLERLRLMRDHCPRDHKMHLERVINAQHEIIDKHYLDVILVLCRKEVNS